jgi:hypothetical protein
LRNADLEEIHMRKQLLLSTGIICLMLAPAVSYGQAPGARGDDQKQMRPADSGRGGASQERGAERAQERAPAAEHAQGGREERGAGSRQTEERGKGSQANERPATAADDKRGRGDDAKPSERAQDSRQDKGGRDAQTVRDGKDAKDSKDSKGSAEMKRDSDREKARADSDKGKEGTTSAQKERETTTQKDAGRDQRDNSKNAEQGKDASKDANRPSTATDTTRTQPSTQSQTTQTQTNQTQVSQQSNLSTDKQVRISQTLTRERLAEPERNLNISIRVGERVPDRVRFHRLPDTIVSIEPEYRGYDYFTTEEEIVIVEPRSHRIVSQIPRDASRIRAAAGGGGGQSTGIAAGSAATGTITAGGSSAPCRIMRRDASGNVTEVTPQTVGSTAQQNSISVSVQVPGGASTAPIPLGAPDGQIVVSSQNGADCVVTLEPQTR